MKSVWCSTFPRVPGATVAKVVGMVQGNAALQEEGFWTGMANPGRRQVQLSDGRESWWIVWSAVWKWERKFDDNKVEILDRGFVPLPGQPQPETAPIIAPWPEPVRWATANTWITAGTTVTNTATAAIAEIGVEELRRQFAAFREEPDEQ